MFENIHADIISIVREKMPLRAIDVLYLVGTNYGLQALIVYRFGRWLKRMRKHLFLGWVIEVPLYPIYWLLYLYVREAYGINLEQTADIAAGLYISHFGGIEVRNCRIGTRCAIYQQVKLGPAKAQDKKLVIGNEVFIGPHAQICTSACVGDRATIGAGTVLTQDVDIPQQCLVLGNPGRIAQHGFDNYKLL